MQNFFQWWTRPPQAILAVLFLVVLVLGLSFSAGRLKRELSSHSLPATSGTVRN